MKNPSTSTVTFSAVVALKIEVEGVDEGVDIIIARHKLNIWVMIGSPEMEHKSQERPQLLLAEGT
jgi:hypothetical protein